MYFRIYDEMKDHSNNTFCIYIVEMLTNKILTNISVAMFNVRRPNCNYFPHNGSWQAARRVVVIDYRELLTSELLPLCGG